MHELAEQFGVIPFLVEVLFQEDNDVVHEVYKKLTKKEKRFLFDRKNITLKDTIGTEACIKNKINKIRNNFYDKRRKT